MRFNLRRGCWLPFCEPAQRWPVRRAAPSQKPRPRPTASAGASHPLLRVLRAPRTPHRGDRLHGAGHVDAALRRRAPGDFGLISFAGEALPGSPDHPGCRGSGIRSPRLAWAISGFAMHFAFRRTVNLDARGVAVMLGRQHCAWRPCSSSRSSVNRAPMRSD